MKRIWSSRLISKSTGFGLTPDSSLGLGTEARTRRDYHWGNKTRLGREEGSGRPTMYLPRSPPNFTWRAFLAEHIDSSTSRSDLRVILCKKLYTHTVSPAIQPSVGVASSPSYGEIEGDFNSQHLALLSLLLMYRAWPNFPERADLKWQVLLRLSIRERLSERVEYEKENQNQNHWLISVAKDKPVTLGCHYVFAFGVRREELEG